MARMRLPYAIALAGVAISVVGFGLSPDLDVTAVLAGGLTVGFSATGAIVAARQPRNPIGWLFLGVGVAAALAVLAPGIADRGVARPGAPGTPTKVAAAYASSSWVPMMLPELTFLLLLFPDGRLIGRRWRIVAWCAGLGIVVTLVAGLIKPGPLEDYPTITNALGVESASGLDGPGFLLLLVAIVGGPVSLVLRFRRADHATREQIKWLTFAGALAATVFVLGFAVSDLLPDKVVYVPMMAGALALPVAAAVAILRYRLYDIDVVINRALVYTGLTATLLAAYLGTVLLAQLVLSPLTEQSDLAIAASTLAVAALFQPARRRIQAAVDQRFFRRRYDAALTLAAFGARLRDEVDLDSLSDDLRVVVAESMQPAHVSLWLRNR